MCACVLFVSNQTVCWPSIAYSTSHNSTYPLLLLLLLLFVAPHILGAVW